MQSGADSRLDEAPSPGLPIVDRRFALGAFLALTGACVVLWAIGWILRDWVSAWPRFSDDAYYYLVIAQNAVAGHGFTMDRISPTNGFHPLWMWTLLPVVKVAGGDIHALLLTVQALCVLLFACAGGILCGLARTRAGAAPAYLVGLMLMFPRIENSALSGLESALVLLLLVLLIAELLRGGALWSAEPRQADARVGGLVGLLLLGRLDSVFLASSLAVYVLVHGLWRGEGAFGTRLWRVVRKELALFWPTLVLVIPYLVSNQLAFGRMMPVSGALKTSFPVAGWSPHHLNVEHLGLLALAVGGCAIELWRGRGRDPLVRLLALFAAGMTAHALYTVLYMRWAVMIWHFITFVPVGALALALLARDVVPRLSRRTVIAALALLTLLQAGALAISLSNLGRTWTVAAHEAGLWVAANLPDDALLAMKDSGIFSYYAQRRVMNLDGLANSFEYARTVCEGRVDDFLQRHGVQYVAQHSVPAAVQTGDYEVFERVYHCRLRGGVDSSLRLRREREVFRSRPYLDSTGRPDQLVIWRID